MSDFNHLEPSERTQLQLLRQTTPFVEETMRQVDRILESETFLRVRENARGFLLFVVGKKLLGCESEIKEVTIAVHVFGKPADYDCSESSTIRVAAENLRGKLIQYYREEGRNDPIEISIPTGTYVPEVRDRRITIAMTTLDDWNPDDEQNHICGTVTDEILYQFRQHGVVQAKRVPVLQAREQGYDYGLRGNLMCSGQGFQLNIAARNLHSLEVVFAEKFEGRRDELLKVSREVADAVVTAIRDGARAFFRRQTHFVARTSRPARKEA